MKRYFLELKYRGDNYSGFQVQKNARSVQEEVERAFRIFFNETISLTGSSRTDAGVHALQNYFHFDMDRDLHDTVLYNLNSIVARDIALVRLREVHPEAHCRFDAQSRSYKYVLYRKKNPFLSDIAFYYPYKLHVAEMQVAAALILGDHDFTSFSKRNTQVKTFNCSISESFWEENDDGYVYHVRANRFLRGMVRGLVGTMLQVGRGKITPERFALILESRNAVLSDFSPPGRGLFLERVQYPETIFKQKLNGDGKIFTG